MDPDTIANIIMMYMLITVLAMWIFGGKQWLRTCEPFTVFFRMVAWLSPIYLKATKKTTKRDYVKSNYDGHVQGY